MLHFFLVLIFLVQSLLEIVFELNLFIGLNRLIVPLGLLYVYYYLFKATFGPGHILFLFIAFISLQSLLYAGPDFTISLLVTNESGVLLYFICGLLFGVFLHYLADLNAGQSAKLKSINGVLIVALVLNLVFFTNLLNQSDMRALVFRFASQLVDSNYQTVGDLYLLVNIIFQFIYIYLFIGVKNKTRLLIPKILYSLNAVVTVVCCQTIGSNLAAVMAAFIFILTVSMTQVITKQANLGILPSCSWVVRSLSKRMVLNSISTTLIGFLILSYFDLFGALRIFNFGEESLISTSISGRVLLVSSFTTLASQYPLFGNMIVDIKNLEPGVYPHALFLSLLTHSGLFGFSLFCCFYFWSLARLILIFRNSTSVDRFINLYVIFFALFTLVIATLFTFWSWTIIWFFLGVTIYIADFKGLLTNTNK